MEYIHPEEKVITEFAGVIAGGSTDLKLICRNFLDWFDKNVIYSRLNAPFYPLQRSDVDVLTMKAGSCGDYTNLIVSVLTALNFDVQYAYVHRDCYGDSQDHICAAVKGEERYILIDPTQPYRKWHGFDCPHQEYELLLPHQFEQRMKTEEAYWKSVAQKRSNDLLAGLLYAPWIYSECVVDTEKCMDNIFFLLSVQNPAQPMLYAYYQHYTAQESFLPVMAKISKAGTVFCFSVHPRSDLWDDSQWSPGYDECAIPHEFLSEKLYMFKLLVAKVKSQVDGILTQAGCYSLI